MLLKNEFEPGQPLVLRFGGSLVEQLGAQLYPSVTATVAELVSNAWDADAKNVWIQIPFGETWAKDSEIVVLDDGNGMTRQMAQETYLVVGRKRRLGPLGVNSEGGRFVHGRKGIGKLAAYGTARLLDCSSLRDGERTDFRMNYDSIRALDPSDDYEVEILPDPMTLRNPAGEELLHGTCVRLTDLKMKRATSEDQFLRSMSRRFALDSSAMTIHLNESKTLARFQIETQFRFPDDGVPNDEIQIIDGWASESVEGCPVRWWIGFTEKPLNDDHQQGISVLANGKMAQRPFKFERSQGTEGQLGQEYLVGEVEADWLDSGIDIEDDLIQSNRDQLQLEDARLGSFLIWGQRRLTWALRKRADLKRELAISTFEAGEEVEELLEPFTATERKRLLGVARSISLIPEVDNYTLVESMRTVVAAQSDRAVREMMEAIEEGDDNTQISMWGLVQQFGLIDARKNLSIIQARLSTITQLKRSIANGAKEVPDIHNLIVRDPWLLDPRWNLLDDELNVGTLGVDFQPELDESGNHLDFLFALAPHAPAPLDEVVVVEIKRGSTKDGKLRKADVDEVNKFHTYVLAVQAHYAKSTDRPRVRGLMIAQDYTGIADATRKSLEGITTVQLAFRTWERVIDDTERMHLGWLAVSKDRLDPEAG